MPLPPLRAPGLILCLAASLALGSPAAALTIDITSFENGGLIPGGSDVVGHTGSRPQLFGVGATAGSRMFVTSTRESGGAVDEASIESAMGLAAGTIDAAFATVPSLSTLGPTNGSAFRITFDALAGDQLLFDWNFITREALPLEPLYTDFGWSDLAFEGTSLDTSSLGDANTGPFFDTGNNNYDQTGWQTATIVLPSSGTYTLTLGVMDVQDTLTDSFMVFDWVRLSRAPEPGTAPLLMLGLLGLAWHGRRRSSG